MDSSGGFAMTRTAIGAAVLGLALSVTAASVSAQAIVSSPVRFGIMGGATLPLSDLSNEEKTGWNAGVLVSIGVPLVPVSFRIDGQWQQLGHKTYTVTEAGAATASFSPRTVFTAAVCRP